jgi:HPt (histidine-containing phosphotransfer) domain-containing protein
MNMRLPVGTFFGINTTDGLGRCLNDHAFYWAQLVAFQTEYGHATTTLIDLIKKRDLKSAELLAHTIKGTAGMLGLEEIQSTSTRLNVNLKTACDTGALPDSIIPDIEAVRQALAQFADGVESFARRMKAP